MENSLKRMRSLCICVCSVLLFAACDDDTQEARTYDNSAIPEGLIEREIGNKWYCLLMASEFRSSDGTQATGSEINIRRRAVQYVRGETEERSGVTVNELSLENDQYSWTNEISEYAAGSFREDDLEFDDLTTQAGSVHTWTSDGTGFFPAFDVDVTPVPAFELLSPQSGVKVSRQEALEVKWDGATLDGATELVRVSLVGSDIDYWILRGGEDSFTIPAELMQSYSPGLVFLILSVEKYRFETRIVDRKTYYFGSSSSTSLDVYLQ